MRRLLVVLLAVSFSAGCGEDEDKKPRRAAPAAAAPAADEQSAVRAQVAAYIRAYLNGDGERACGYYAPEFRARADSIARAKGLAGCSDVLRRVGPKILESVDDPGQRADLLESAGDPRNVKADVTGRTATASLAPLRPGASPPRVRLEHRGAKWLIVALGVREE